MNITEIANRIAEMHYPNKPKAMDEEILFDKWRESLGMDWNEFLEYTETMQSYIDFAKWYKENTKEMEKPLDKVFICDRIQHFSNKLVNACNDGDAVLTCHYAAKIRGFLEQLDR